MTDRTHRFAFGLREKLAWLGMLALSACASPRGEPASASAAPAGAPATAAPGSVDESNSGASVFAVHQVNDFEAFRKFLEAGASERAKAGVKAYLLSRMDDGRVVIHFVADNAEQVQAALDSPELQQYLSKTGAPEATLVWVVHNDVLKVPANAPTGPTFSLFLKLHVGDFEALKREFEKLTRVFAEEGVIAEGLHQSTARAEIAILHLVGTARDKLEALPARPEFERMLAAAGSKKDATPFVGADVARSRPN